MVASVQELILAANAKRDESPLISIAKALASGYDSYRTSKTSSLEDLARQVSIQKNQQEMIQAKKDAEYQLQEKIKNGFNSLESKNSAFPQDKLKKTTNVDEKGNISYKYETINPAENISPDAISYIDKGDLVGLSKLMPNGIPQRIASLTTTNKSLKGVADRFDTSQLQSQEQSAKQATYKLQNQFLSESKSFKDSTEAYQRIVASAKDPSPAGDLALIYNYMKVLDPGSTVREGEFATAAAAGSFGDRVKAAVLKINNGERLPETMRADFVNRASILYDSQKELQSQRESEFKRAGEATGANVDSAIMKLSAPSSIPSQTKVIDGVNYIKKDGKWYAQ